MAETNKRRIVVIGGGASGMLSAYSCATENPDAEVYIIEKNEKLGKKMFITGKGRCNLTNACDMHEFYKNIPTNPKFLYRAFSAFTNEDIIRLIEENGTALKTERGGRVFPVSDKSSDVIKALSRLIGKAGVKVALKTAVREILVKDGEVKGIRTDKGTLPCDAVILCTGGFSYTQTGSSGEGHVMASALGHHPTAIYPSLIELTTHEIAEMKKLRGLLLKNVTVTLLEKGKKAFSELGEMEFMSYGFGGALAISASAYIKDRSFADTILEIDLKPGLTSEQLDSRLVRDFSESPNTQLKVVLKKLMPMSLIDIVLSRAEIDGNKKPNNIKKEERLRLVEVVKALRFKVSGTRPMNEAIITRGGIPVLEINPATMESKLIKSLYFSGEIIDIDALTGGFNLQIAFSTGYLAGKNAAF